MLPARALAEPTLVEGPAFQQRTNTSWRSTRSQPAVSRRLFRCLGAHLLRSPLIVKTGLISPSLVSATNGHTPSVERDRSVSANSVLRPVTSFRCPFFSTHSFDPFGSLVLITHGQTKNPATIAVSRVWKFYGLRLPAYLRSIQFGFLTPIRPGQAKAEHTIRPAMTCRTSDRLWPNRG